MPRVPDVHYNTVQAPKASQNYWCCISHNIYSARRGKVSCLSIYPCTANLRATAVVVFLFTTSALHGCPVSPTVIMSIVSQRTCTENLFQLLFLHFSLRILIIGDLSGDLSLSVVRDPLSVAQYPRTKNLLRLLYRCSSTYRIRLKHTKQQYGTRQPHHYRTCFSSRASFNRNVT